MWVLQAENKVTRSLAAAKVCELKVEEELEDFTTEIDILTACKHRNIVALHESFFYGGKLWVRNFENFCKNKLIFI